MTPTHKVVRLTRYHVYKRHGCWWATLYAAAGRQVEIDCVAVEDTIEDVWRELSLHARGAETEMRKVFNGTDA